MAKPDEAVRPMTQLDMLAEVTHNSRFLMQAMAWYLKEQSEQAAQTPALAQLITFNLLNPILPSPQALQVLPKNERRYKVGFANYGPADILISEKYFDPVSILQLFSDPNAPDAILPGYNQAIPIGFLEAGTNVTVNGTVGVWAYSLGSTAGSNKNAILSIMDSIYADADTVAPLSQVGAFHMDGLHKDEMPGGGIVN